MKLVQGISVVREVAVEFQTENIQNIHIHSIYLQAIKGNIV